MGRFRLLVLAGLLGLAALYAGGRFVSGRIEPPRHPLTGRQIAGLATNAAWLDRRDREQEEAPDQALALLGIQPGMTVADVGAGTGYMTLRLAQLVGPGGKVFANDIQPHLLAVLQEKARAQGLSNIEMLLGTERDAGLPADAVDLVLLVDVYHEMGEPQAMLRSLRRSLKTGGQLVLLEYRKEDPTIPIAEAHRMSVADVRREVEPEGFVFDRAVEDLPRQHILIFRHAR